LHDRHVERGLEHVAHAALIADPALELADALLALEGGRRHGSEIRGGQTSAATVCSRPVSIVRKARQPSLSAAAVGSSVVRHPSRGRGGETSAWKPSRPTARPIRPASSSTLVSTRVPTLKGPRPPLASAASRAATTSNTCT